MAVRVTAAVVKAVEDEAVVERVTVAARAVRVAARAAVATQAEPDHSRCFPHTVVRRWGRTHRPCDDQSSQLMSLGACSRRSHAIRSNSRRIPCNRLERSEC